MRVYFIKVVPDPNEPDIYSTGWAEDVVRDGRYLVLHNCQTCIAFHDGKTIGKRVIQLGNIRIDRAIISRVPAPDWFRRITDPDQPLPVSDRSSGALLLDGRA